MHFFHSGVDDYAVTLETYFFMPSENGNSNSSNRF